MFCIRLLLLLLIPTSLLSQNPTNVGIWEQFDKYTLPLESVYHNTNENYNGRDDDSNGYIDDVHGIGFNSNEEIIVEKFYTNYKNRANYNHGTSVANIILQSNPNIILHGVGFVPTSKRLDKSGVLALNVENRLAGLDNEYKQMEYFISKSIAYFNSKKCKVVNISWGLNLESFVSTNTNLGNSKKERLKNSKKWLRKFKQKLKIEFKKHPDIYFIVAVGNNGLSVKDAFDVPGTIKLRNVITVGALNKENNNIASFSNYGKRVLYASGTSIKTKKALKFPTVQSGTSIATPKITAYIAQLISEHSSKKDIRKKTKFTFKLPK